MTKSALRVMWVVPPAVVIAASWSNRQDFSLDSRRAQSSDAQYEARTGGRGGAVVTSIDNVLHWSQRPGLKDFVVVAQIENTTPLNLIGSPTFASPSCLRGANILVDAPNNGFAITLRVILKKHGVVRKVAAESLGSLSVWLQDFNQALDIIAANTEKLMTSLQAQGVPAEAALAVVESSPKTLGPDVNGIKCLIVHRLKLGLFGLLGENSNYEQIVDCSLLS